MPSIPVSTPLGYVGVFFLIAGFFLVIAGLDILKLKNLTVATGKKTWSAGLILAVLGIPFLLPDINIAIDSSATPTETQVSSPMPSETSLFTAVASETPIAPSLTVFEGDFSVGDKWEHVNVYNGYMTTSHVAVNNAIRWTVTGEKSLVSTDISPINLPGVSDFILEVTLKQIDGDDSIRHGIVFRQGQDGEYSFLIRRAGDFFLRRSKDGGGQDVLINYTPSPAINKSGENTLKVIAIGDTFQFFINNTFVWKFIDKEPYFSGKTRASVWINESKSATFDITKFRLEVK